MRSDRLFRQALVAARDARGRKEAYAQQTLKMLDDQHQSQLNFEANKAALTMLGGLTQQQMQNQGALNLENLRQSQVPASYTEESIDAMGDPITRTRTYGARGQGATGAGAIDLAGDTGGEQKQQKQKSIDAQQKQTPTEASKVLPNTGFPAPSPRDLQVPQQQPYTGAPPPRQQQQNDVSAVYSLITNMLANPGRNVSRNLNLGGQQSDYGYPLQNVHAAPGSGYMRITDSKTGEVLGQQGDPAAYGINLPRQNSGRVAGIVQTASTTQAQPSPNDKAKNIFKSYSPQINTGSSAPGVANAALAPSAAILSTTGRPAPQPRNLVPLGANQEQTASNNWLVPYMPKPTAPALPNVNQRPAAQEPVYPFSIPGATMPQEYDQIAQLNNPDYYQGITLTQPGRGWNAGF